MVGLAPEVVAAAVDMVEADCVGAAPPPLPLPSVQAVDQLEVQAVGRTLSRTLPLSSELDVGAGAGAVVVSGWA